jgi:catechol O-methyltransferase
LFRITQSQTDLFLQALKEWTPTFDMVFIDHHKAVYLSDLKILIDQKFLKKGSVVIADNVRFPGAPEYLAYVEKSDAFVTTRHETQVEYLPFLKDLVTVSIYR